MFETSGAVLKRYSALWSALSSFGMCLGFLVMGYSSTASDVISFETVSYILIAHLLLGFVLLCFHDTPYHFIFSATDMSSRVAVMMVAAMIQKDKTSLFQSSSFFAMGVGMFGPLEYLAYAVSVSLITQKEKKKQQK